MSIEVMALYVVVSLLVLVTVVLGLLCAGFKKQLECLDRRVDDKLPITYRNQIWENNHLIGQLANHFNLKFTRMPERTVVEELGDGE